MGMWKNRANKKKGLKRGLRISVAKIKTKTVWKEVKHFGRQNIVE